MCASQVIACFVIYSNDEITYQGTFQVLETMGFQSVQSSDGGEFQFNHCYKGARCDIELAYAKSGLTLSKCNLAIPINRTKIKWKHVDLGEQHRVHYRCALEDLDSRKTQRKMQQSRGKATLRGNTQVGGAIDYIGQPEPEGDG